MKYRTCAIFILTAAAIASVPQAFQQIVSLKEAAGNRVGAGIWNVLLSLHGQKAVDAPRKSTAARTQELAANAKSDEASPLRDKTKPVAASKTRAKSDASARVHAANVERRKWVSEVELAMLEIPDDTFRIIGVPEAGPKAYAPITMNMVGTHKVGEALNALSLARYGKLLEEQLRHIDIKKERKHAVRLAPEQREALRAARVKGQGEYVFRFDPRGAPQEAPEARSISNEDSDTNMN